MGFSRQAIYGAFSRMFPGEDPPGDPEGPARRARVLELSRLGRPDREIANETHFSISHVRALARAANLPTDGTKRRLEKEQAFLGALEAVRAGATLGQAAGDYGVSYGRLEQRCKGSGVEPRPVSSPRDGRAVAAADIVERTEEKVGVSEAARRMRCAPTSVREVLARRARALPDS